MRLRNFCLFFRRATLVAFFLCLITSLPAISSPIITAPPLGEQWFGIFVDNELMGFSRMKISMAEGGYRIEGYSSVRMQIMGFAREATHREVYSVGRSLTLKNFEIEQNLGGKRSVLSGKSVSSGLQVRREAEGKVSERTLKTRGEIFPGAVLNMLPLLRGGNAGRQYRVQTFDPEDVKIKDVRITLVGEKKTPDGIDAVHLQNNLYPFVDNDIWVDRSGKTLLESVRDGLVITRAETQEILAPFVSGIALSQKDLVYDFSMVRASPPLATPVAELEGLIASIRGYDDRLPLLPDSPQDMERNGTELLIRTGILRTTPHKPDLSADNRFLAPSERIQSTDPEIIAKSLEIVGANGTTLEKVAMLARFTAEWLKDSIDDSGSALAALKMKSGNCQSHARLYTALARAAGIPTRFVTGLVSQDGKGFLYHSWAESFIESQWLTVDPTFNQVPADPTHLALLEGDTPSDIAPLAGIIGRIQLHMLEER